MITDKTRLIKTFAKKRKKGYDEYGDLEYTAYLEFGKKFGVSTGFFGKNILKRDKSKTYTHDKIAKRLEKLKLVDDYDRGITEAKRMTKSHIHDYGFIWREVLDDNENVQYRLEYHEDEDRYKKKAKENKLKKN